MALTLVPRLSRALAEQLNAYYRVLRGQDPDSVDLRLNGGGHFTVHHSGTNDVLFTVTDSGATGTIVPVDGSVTNSKLGPNAVTTDKIQDGAILDADVNAAAGIAVTKLAHVGAGNVLRSTGTANVGGQVVNGDVSPTAGIVVSKLASGATANRVVATTDGLNVTMQQVTDAMVSATAAIAPAKLAAVAANQILKDVGSGVVGGGLLVDANVAAAGTANIALGKLAPGSAGVLKSNGTTITAGNLIVTSDMGANTINGDRIQDATIVGAKITGGAPPPNGTGAADAWKVYATAAAGTTVSLQQVQKEMLAPGVGMVRLGLYTLATPTPVVDFDPIPQTYTALRVVILARSVVAAITDTMILQKNLITPSYYDQQFVGAGSVAVAGTYLNAASSTIGTVPGATAPGGVGMAALIVVDISGYTSATLHQHWISMNSVMWDSPAGARQAGITGGTLVSAGAITKLRFGTSGGNMAAGSILALFGY